jgi:hypothetical protein
MIVQPLLNVYYLKHYCVLLAAQVNGNNSNNKMYVYYLLKHTQEAILYTLYWRLVSGPKLVVKIMCTS